MNYMISEQLNDENTKFKNKCSINKLAEKLIYGRNFQVDKSASEEWRKTAGLEAMQVCRLRCICMNAE